MKCKGSMVRHFRTMPGLRSTTLLGLAPLLPYISKAPGKMLQEHVLVPVSSAAPGNTQDLGATLAILQGKECQGCSEV